MQMGQRSIVAAQMDAALASARALAALVPRRQAAAAGPHLVAIEASLAAAKALLGVEFMEEEAPSQAAAGACPSCQSPRDRQRNMSGMGDGPEEWLCLDCGAEYQS